MIQLADDRVMVRFSDTNKQERGIILPLKVKIGIHPGPAVVGTFGNDLQVEFNTVGVTVNLASKMEALADSGTTFVTEENFNRPLRPDPKTGIPCGNFFIDTQGLFPILPHRKSEFLIHLSFNKTLKGGLYEEPRV